MARFSAAWKTNGAGTASLPIAGLMATAAVRPRLVEVGIFNTTSTAVELILQRIVTAVGTPGSTITAAYEDDNSQSAVSTAKDTWTVAPTLGGKLRQGTLGGAAGSGIIWTFGGGKTPGLVVPNSTNDGIGLLPVGTGQICDVYFVWDE